MISLTYISHHVINSNGLPSYFILTLAHRLFIIQPLLTSLNSLLVTLPIPHAVFSHPGLLAVLNTLQLILTLALWYSLFSLPEMHFPLTVHGLLLHFIQSLLKCHLFQEGFPDHALYNTFPALPFCTLKSLTYFIFLQITCRYLKVSCYSCMLLSLPSEYKDPWGQELCLIFFHSCIPEHRRMCGGT